MGTRGGQSTGGHVAACSEGGGFRGGFAHCLSVCLSVLQLEAYILVSVALTWGRLTCSLLDLVCLPQLSAVEVDPACPSISQAGGRVHPGPRICPGTSQVCVCL